ncbi:hypothetical protein [uncultured Mucilaginibacter sp.]|uniref:hypothetical protein n=1 Tax=uncultured Mucilaginibacter sp. TaxID=797541 RepID=UPI0026183239|nr:hypothetical protein [uncultured Mucilaginibacter sp.]
MKRLFLLLLCLFNIVGIVLAQRPEKNITLSQTSNNLQIGFHLMNIEDDKFALDYLKIEYQKDISKYSAFSTSFGFAAYTKYSSSKFFPSLHLPEEDIKRFNQSNNQSSLFMFNVNYVYNIYPFKRGNFVVKAGPTVSYLIEVRDTDGFSQIGFKPDGSYVYEYTNYSTFKKSYDYGINFILGYNFDLSKKFNLITYVNYQKYLQNVNPYIYALGVEVGYKF